MEMAVRERRCQPDQAQMRAPLSWRVQAIYFPRLARRRPSRNTLSLQKRAGPLFLSCCRLFTRVCLCVFVFFVLKWPHRMMDGCSCSLWLSTYYCCTSHSIARQIHPVNCRASVVQYSSQADSRVAGARACQFAPRSLCFIYGH